ncbi:MAG: hypothetical protein WCG80_16790 [Spirochaetales bacterium]
MTIKVYRDSRSLDFKRLGKDSPDAWDNNDKNNMLDVFQLWHNGRILHECKVQTVANIPGGRFLNTIAPGIFGIKLFVEPRAFRGRIHGIVNAVDLEGQRIDGRSVEPVPGKNGAPVDFARWLEHDTQKHAPAAPGEVTRVAWSAGCIIHHPNDLELLGDIYDAYGLAPGTVIDAELVML